MQEKTCCAPLRPGCNTSAVVAKNDVLRASDCVDLVMADIPGGTALIGTAIPELPQDGEGPLRRKKLKPYQLGVTTVTNAQFQTFVEDTGYLTEAERIGDSLVFQCLLPKGSPPTPAVAEAPWWRLVQGANWRTPFGPNAPGALPDHPVVHVSWNDAAAFARWAGGRLPTEAEWEHAARGALGDVRFPWGNREPDDKSFQPCNIWQGRFPQQDLGLDGYRGAAPARSFDANGYGLYNMVGNVWEWTSELFKIRSLKKTARDAQIGKTGFRLCKGGSFLCHRSYCYRYRIAARNSSSSNSSTSHIGFRIAFGSVRRN